MTSTQVTAGARQHPSLDLTQPLTHAHSFAIRQTVLNQLNTSQLAEHECLNAMRDISKDNTKAILAILTQWICTDHVRTTQAEIEAVQQISGQSHDKWVHLLGKKAELGTSLDSTKDELYKAKGRYDEVGGLMKGMFAKGEDATRIKEAKTSYEALKAKVLELEKALKETDAAIQLYGDTFLMQCCKNLDQLPATTPLGEAIHSVVLGTSKKLTDEWFRHCQRQQQELEAISKNIACLNGMYATEVKS
jgi:hypothetical protein